MSKLQKLADRLHSKPKDSAWEEMKGLLKHYGYEEIPSGKTGSSRRKFINQAHVIISLHEPHPRKVLK